MIVAIDGPAGAGKSSTAAQLAKRLGFRFLDTGAMYRGVALLAQRRGASPDDEKAILEAAGSGSLRYDGANVWIGEEDVSLAIRDPSLKNHLKAAADHPGVRQVMVKQQREYALFGDTVTEGRDQGTVVFPGAECKIFLTATPETRAQRRCDQLAELGKAANFHAILDDIKLRDAQDAGRKVGPMLAAQDAEWVWTDNKTFDEVVDELVAVVEKAKKRARGAREQHG